MTPRLLPNVKWTQLVRIVRNENTVLLVQHASVEDPSGRTITWYQIGEHWSPEPGVWVPGRKTINIRQPEVPEVIAALLHQYVYQLPSSLKDTAQRIVAMWTRK